MLSYLALNQNTGRLTDGSVASWIFFTSHQGTSTNCDEMWRYSFNVTAVKCTISRGGGWFLKVLKVATFHYKTFTRHCHGSLTWTWRKSCSLLDTSATGHDGHFGKHSLSHEDLFLLFSLFVFFTRYSVAVSVEIQWDCIWIESENVSLFVLPRTGNIS